MDAYTNPLFSGDTYFGTSVLVVNSLSDSLALAKSVLEFVCAAELSSAAGSSSMGEPSANGESFSLKIHVGHLSPPRLFGDD